MNWHCAPLCAFVVLSACAHINTAPSAKFLGDPAPDVAATQTIEIRPDTKWVNVTGGDIVKFVVGGKSFAWAFNVGSGVSHFDLSRVAPSGVLDRPVFVYLAPDPKYMGGGDGDRGLGQ